MGWAETPREAAAGADVLFTMLTNTDAVEQAADGDDGILAGLRPGTVWADLSTISPDASVALGGTGRRDRAHTSWTPRSPAAPPRWPPDRCR